MKKVTSVEEYIGRHPKHAIGLEKLKNLIEKTELKESIKWNAPVYTIDGKNVLSLAAFKSHFGIWFFNGVFLKDENNLLENAQEGKTKAMRHMKFSKVEDIQANLVMPYIREAISNQKQGMKLKPIKSKTKDVIVPQELDAQLKSSAELNKAFQDLSPYKRKEFCEYISTAKREATKQSRLQKIIPMIKDGVGLNDKYRNC